MKNIEISIIEKYNQALEAGESLEDKETIERFLTATIIHLEEDLKKAQNSALSTLYQRAIQAEEKVLKTQSLDLDAFRQFNAYNTIKIREIKIIAAATVFLMLLLVASHMLFN